MISTSSTNIAWGYKTGGYPMKVMPKLTTDASFAAVTIA